MAQTFGFMLYVLGLGLESQVLGLGLVKFSMTHRCTDTTSKSKKVLMIRAKTVISISSFPY